MSETLDQLIQLSVKKFNLAHSDIGPDTDFFEKLNLNSLQALSLLTDIEKHFSIEIPDYELQGVTTFQGLADVIDSHLV